VSHDVLNSGEASVTSPPVLSLQELTCRNIICLKENTSVGPRRLRLPNQ
jgi:hypothetical protein